MKKLKSLIPAILIAMIFFVSCSKEDKKEVAPTVVVPSPNPSVSAIQNELNNGKTPLQLFNDGVSMENIYCNIYAGGIIFYLDTITGNGLVCATNDQATNIMWTTGCVYSGINFYCSYIGVNDTSLWAGASNSNMTNFSGFAAYTCTSYNGGSFTDWFLPSKHELWLVFKNVKLKGKGNFTDTVYWSSSEAGSGALENQAFRIYPDGETGMYYKDYPCNVRAVRKFIN